MKNNRGAASILVILIIVVLATFGGIALTAGYTNKQLAIKAAQSKADYYMLDGAGEAIVATVDSLLYDAARESTVYLNSLMALDDKDTIKKDIRLEALFSHDNTQVESHALQVKKLSDIYDRIYFYNSNKSEDLLHIETEGCIVNIRVNLKDKDNRNRATTRHLNDLIECIYDLSQ